MEGRNFQFQDLSSIDDEDDESLGLRHFLLGKHLSVPSHTQFVEFGAKEAKHVSQTNRQEETRSCHSIVKSAHVTDASNSRSGSITQDMIVNRIIAARKASDEHERLAQEDAHETQMSTVLSLLRLAHFKKERVGLNKDRIDERASNDKAINKTQRLPPQQLTAAVAGHVEFGKIVQRLHMEDLGIELMERGVPIEESPDSISVRKLWLQELEAT